MNPRVNPEIPPPDPFAAAVTRPLALTVMFAFVKDPTLEFTVAKVFAHDPADVVTSPDRAGSAPQGSAVAFIRFIAEGVPRLGVTNVGELVRTRLPVPVRFVVVRAVPPLITREVFAVSVVNVPDAGVVPPMTPGDRNVAPFKVVALIVPDPEVDSDAPEPTTIAAVMFVPLVMAGKDVLTVPEQLPGAQAVPL